MASKKNRTRKRNKKTHRKRYRKIATRHMRGGGMFSLFNDLRANVASGFNAFGSKAKAEATTTFNNKKAEAEAKITQAKGFVDKKTACLASCARI